MKINISLCLTVLFLTGCGGGGSSTSINDSTSNAAENVTFSNQISPAVSFNTLKAIAVTSIDQPVDQKVSLGSFFERLYAMVGIRSAFAAEVPTPINALFYLDASSNFNRIDYLQVIDPATGGRKSITDATLKSIEGSFAPSITGVLTTPRFILQSVKNLYKPDAAGKIDRNNSSTLCPILAIERTTGKVSCINVKPWCEAFVNCGNTFGNTSIQSNGTGSIVYLQDVDHNLIKLDLTNFPDIVTTQLTTVETEGFIQSLVVNKDGDAYVNIDTRVPFQNIFRIYKISGGFTSLNNTNLFNFVNCPFSGPSTLNDINNRPDANNYYFADDRNQYWKISKDANGDFADPQQLVNSFQMSISSGNNCTNLVKDGSYAHSIPDPQWNKNFVVELAYPNIIQGNKTPWKIDFSSQLVRIVDLHSYAGHLIIWGKDAQDKDILVKYTKANGATGAMSTFFNAASPDKVLSLTVSSTGEVIAVLQQTSTGDKRLASLNTSILNGVSIIKPLDTSPAQILSLN